MKIGIIGNGFVGSAIMHGFILHVDDIMIYDKDPKRTTHSMEALVNNSDVIFICVPTPLVDKAWSDKTKTFNFFCIYLHKLRTNLCHNIH